MKRGFTIGILAQSRSRRCGNTFKRHLRCQSNLALSHLQAKSWQLFWDCNGILIVEYIYNHGRCVFEHNEVFEKSNQRKTSWIIDSRRDIAAWQWQRTRSQVEGSADCYSGVRVSGDEPSTLQPRLGTQWLLSVQTFEEALAVVLIAKWHTHSGGWLFHRSWGPRSQLLPGRNIITPNKVEQVHRNQGRLYWKIIKHQLI